MNLRGGSREDAETQVRPVRRYGLVSTFPPTQCGLASFAAGLSRELMAMDARVDVVRLTDSLGSRSKVLPSLSEAVVTLNECDVAIVQHDYGLYGGPDGDEIIELVRKIEIPLIVIAHTVLVEPNNNQKRILELVVEASECTVVMSQVAKYRMFRHFNVNPAKIHVIPHGCNAFVSKPFAPSTDPPLLLSWGFFGQGKGFEWSIDAVMNLTNLTPAPQYILAGRTHPKVFAAEGETYRNMLKLRVAANGVSSSIIFDDAYKDQRSLATLIHRATAIVLPYDSSDQVSSGVLVEALASGKPVIATDFPQAVELLSGGAGLIVPRRNPDALEGAFRRIFTEPGLAEEMALEATRIGPQFDWRTAALSYAKIADRLVGASEVEHV
jgi:glycosyltransferase involved in cell wall biosynthesis